MSIAESTPASSSSIALTELAIAVADVNWFTTENLFRELDDQAVSSLLLTAIDFRNAWRRGERPWTWNRPRRQSESRQWRRDLVLPSGWMKKFPRIGMRPIAGEIRRWRESNANGNPLALVMTYPHYLYLRDQIRAEVSVYFNVDDYGLYWPSHAGAIRSLELKAVRESTLTVCTSRLRADLLRDAVPEAAHKVQHLPHGAPAWTIEPRPFARPAPAPMDIAQLPRPFLGYVGSMEDRVDWTLIGRLAQRFPKASIVLVGRVPAAAEGDWYTQMHNVLSRPNVHSIGWRPQAEIAGYNRAFDVALIPYDTDHPFNVACCPTKIMDSMGSGRPIVSTDLPECRLYRHLFDVAEDHEAFLNAVSTILDANSDDGRSALRHAHAEANSCRHTVRRLLDWLSR